jgi:hypothetical protein
MFKSYYFLSLALSVFASTALQAQTTKGTRILGLSAGQLDYQKRNNISNFSGVITPSAGVFLVDNLAVGASVPVGYYFTKYNGFSSYEKSRLLEIGLLPWLRYYIPSQSRHRVFGELSAGGVFSSYRAKQLGSTTFSGNDTDFRASAGLGYTYFLTPAVGLEALAAYSRNSGNRDSFGRGNLGLNLGFRIYLPSGAAQ